MSHRPLQSLAQRNTRRPAEAAQPCRVNQLARCAVGLAAIEHQPTLVTDCVGHHAGQRGDVHFVAAAAVQVRALRRAERSDRRPWLLHHQQAGIGQVVDVQEFAHRLPAAPDGKLGCVIHQGLVAAPDQAGHDMAVLQMKVVTGTVQVGRHDGTEVGAELPVIALAHLDGSDLGDRIRLIGRLQRTSQQILFTHRLRRGTWVDTG